MRWARSTFLHVMGKKAPALTVASLAMTMTMPAGDEADAGDDAGRRSAAPVAVHIPGGPQAEFKEVGAGVDQAGNAFAGGEPALVVLAVDGLGAAALADRLFFALEWFDLLGEFIGHYFRPTSNSSAQCPLHTPAKPASCAAVVVEVLGLSRRRRSLYSPIPPCNGRAAVPVTIPPAPLL